MVDTDELVVISVGDLHSFDPPEQLLISMFGKSMLEYFPDPIAIRFLNALWFRVFKAKVESETQDLHVYCKQALSYFQWLLDHVSYKAKHEDTCRMSKLHFDACIYIIIGNLHRQLFFSGKSAVKSVAASPDAHEEGFYTKSELSCISRWYSRAEEVFFHEGQGYAEMSLLLGYTENLLESCLYAIKSAMSAFRAQREVAVIASIEDVLRSKSIDLHVPSLHISCLEWALLAMKVQFDFASSLEIQLATAESLLEAEVKTALAVDQFESLSQVCIAAILMSIYCSGVWRCSSDMGKRISSRVNSLPVQLNDKGFFIPTKAHYKAANAALHAVYTSLPSSYCSLIKSSSFSEPHSISLNHSIGFLLRLCKILIDCADTVAHGLGKFISALLTWCASIYHVIQKQEINLDDLKPSVMTFLHRSSASVAKGHFKAIKNSLLQYALPEDELLRGFITFPPRFCVMGGDDGFLNASLFCCSSANLVSSTSTSLPASYGRSWCRVIASDETNEMDFIGNIERYLDSRKSCFDHHGDNDDGGNQHHNHLTADKRLPEIEDFESLCRYGRILVITSPLFCPEFQSQPSKSELKMLKCAHIDRLPTSKNASRLIVIDGPNVAMRHGGFTRKQFSTRGIQLALNYYRERKNKVVVFVPKNTVDYEYVAKEKRTLRFKPSKHLKVKVPDTVEPLIELIKQGVLILIPPGDYDDSYMIRHARDQNGYIISNDMYRDYTSKALTRREEKESNEWIKSHVITFTFIDDQFFPNPLFEYSDGFR